MSQSMHRLLATLILTLAALPLSAAQQDEVWYSDFQPDDPSIVDVVPQEFRFNGGAEPQTLDPALITGLAEGRLASALFEGLVVNDPRDLSIRPGVADTWSVSDDLLTYTFHLRPDAKWSDGKAVTAQHFADSWRRVLTPETASEYAYQLFPIANAEAHLRGEAPWSDVGVDVVDERTLEVRLERPCPYFLMLCAFTTLLPVRLDVIETYGDRWTRPGSLVGNGPFMLAEWKPKQVLEMTPNPHWWAKEYVKLDRISVYPYDDLDAALRLFKVQKLDWLPAVPVARMEELLNDPDFYVEPFLGTYFYRFNCNRPPFDDARVRRAFSMAVDRTPITRDVTKAGQTPATWFCPPVAGYEHVEGLPYDPDRARSELQSYIDDHGELPEIELLYNTSENHKAIAETVARQWREVLGVKVTPVNREWKIYLQDMSNLNYQIARSSWIGDYGDPNTFFDMFVTDGGNNRTGWSSARYDQLVELSQATIDHSKRLQLFREMETILVEQDLPIMPIYIYVSTYMLAEHVGGFTHNVRSHILFQCLWME